jgi:hypothetical protein
MPIKKTVKNKKPKVKKDNIAELKAEIEMLKLKVSQLERDSHPMHFMPCRYNPPSTLPGHDGHPLQPWTGPGGYPVVTC